MYISTCRLYWEYYICMNACMYVYIMYVCMFALQSACHSARRSLIGALIGALCAVDVSQVKYARIENVCIYRRADYTGSTIYVWRYRYWALLHVQSTICVCVCLCTSATPRSL